MKTIHYETAGESHGPELTVILSGLPAGLPLSAETVGADMARRRTGAGAGARMAIESDAVEITGGVLDGRTTGAPVALRIPNADHAAWRGKTVPAFTVPRPGHADFAATVKYGYADLRPALERASARETAARVAAGSCCRAFLSAFGIVVEGRVAEVGGEGPERAETRIEAAKAAGDTLGGVIEVTVRGVPPGLGSHVAAGRRLDARLAAAWMSVPAVKGVEIGGGFALARATGVTAPRDASGGIDGGVSNGDAIVARVAMKPVPTTATPRESVDLATGETARTVYQRSDTCPVFRAAVILETETCVVLADALAEKLGGDSLPEMLGRFAALPRTVRLDGSARAWW